MGETPNSNPETREPEAKKSNEFRKKFEGRFPFIEKPYEEWNEDEKEKFGIVWQFNNFCIKIPGSRYATRESFEKSYGKGSFDVPVKDVFNYTNDETTRFKEAGHSEKYLNGTEKEFYENIEQALINNGVDIGKFKELMSQKDGATDALRKIEHRRDDPDRFDELNTERIKLKNLIEITVYPAILDLLDQGYSELDITK